MYTRPPEDPVRDATAILPELVEFLRIPSISTLPAHAEDMRRAAQWVAAYLQRAGLEHVVILPTAGHPLVYADWLHAPQQPTILIYGHYDVQPPDPLAAWQTPPFEPTVRDGNLYARGASDDKGQLYVHLRAVHEQLHMYGALPVNVRFLIEGGEEVGSAGISQYVRDHPAELRADTVLISDSPMFADGQPALTLGLRGSVSAALVVQTASQDLHSGLYGGVAPNAAHALSRIVAGLTDAQGRVQIPGYYDPVRPPTAAEQAHWRTFPFDEATYATAIGVRTLVGDLAAPILERLWAWPTLDVTGMWSGFTGEGLKTIIPARAQATINLRLVPDQDPAVVAGALERTVAALCPPWAVARVEILNGTPPVLIPATAGALQAAAAALAEAFGRPPYLVRVGGSIPIVALFQQILQAPCVLMGLGLPDDNLHAPNEKMKLDNIYRGISASVGFMRRLGH